ncbi:TolC family protein [Prevotella aurantiaca]|jgi:outer membrane efflux protein|uniref:TolC family protein n=1 Tax=Prevotella aurantiaca TaxID=596085 RepID=A0A930HMP5_9BACT|nr:TolC family protein [Prevotella aurantiaca]MBF1384645.1 TolC family protein [Prevotella aurantiaca]
MSKVKILFVLIMSFCLLLATQAEARKWTLQECLDYALKHNVTLRQNVLTKASAHESVLQSQAELFPLVNASTSQNLSYTPFPQTGRATVTNGYVTSSVDKLSYNGMYAINFNWTIWNGNQNRMKIRQNKLTEQQATVDSAITANSIQEQITQIYIQILYTAEAIKVNEKSLEWSKENEERGNTMVEVGTFSKADLSQLTAQRANDEYNVVAQQGNLLNYTRQLKQLLEITDEDFEIAIPDSLNGDALAEIPGLQTVYERALTSRPEIKGKQLTVEAGELSIKQAKAQYLPTIGLSGGISSNVTTMNSNAYGTQLKNNLAGGVGITINIPIWDQRQTRTAVNKARISLESNQLALQNQRTQLYSTIENYWIQASTNQAKYKSAVVNTESQQTNYEMLSEQFRLGLKNIVELREGMNNLITAQQNELQSKYMTLYNLQMLNFYENGQVK